MTPDDVGAVQASWSELRCLQEPLVAGLARRFAAAGTSPIPPAERARWVIGAVEDLVGLLPAPSRLAARARALGATWPDPCTAPSPGVEGRAWLAAACDCLPGWTPRTEAAWRQAWVLLSDVLAAEALSPFEVDPRPGAAGHGLAGG
jgi:hypothetical protein